MSLEIEQMMKAELDGTFRYLCEETGESRVRKVSANFMPSFEPYGLKFTGANNGAYKPWTRELDDKLIAARHSGLMWRKVGTVVKRNVRDCALRYYEVCEQRGIEPLVDMRRMKRGA